MVSFLLFGYSPNDSYVATILLFCIILAAFLKNTYQKMLINFLLYFSWILPFTQKKHVVLFSYCTLLCPLLSIHNSAQTKTRHSVYDDLISAVHLKLFGVKLGFVYLAHHILILYVYLSESTNLPHVLIWYLYLMIKNFLMCRIASCCIFVMCSMYMFIAC